MRARAKRRVPPRRRATKTTVQTFMNLKSTALTAGSLLASAMLMLHSSGCGSKKPQRYGAREIRVTVQTLQKRTFRRQIPVQGTVTPIQHAVISAKIAGTLERLEVDEGSTVPKGTVLFSIDSQVLKNRVTVCEDEVKVKEAGLESARRAEDSARITLEKAAKDLKRYRDMWSKNATSRAELETYETNFRKAEMDVRIAHAAVVNAEAQLKQARSNLDIARKNYADSIIVAPFDCTVTQKFVERNEFVAVGQNILRLENHNALEVECYISAVHYDLITPGVTPAIFGRGGRAVVTYKAPSIDPESRTFKIKIRLPANTGLKSGMLCTLKLVIEEKEAFGLPVDAILLRANDRYIAYTVDDRDVAHSVEIKRGIIDGKFCEVVNASELAGLRFVVTGQTFINNGTRLKVVAPRNPRGR